MLLVERRFSAGAGKAVSLCSMPTLSRKGAATMGHPDFRLAGLRGPEEF